ncbi:MAG: hypothetical protein HYS41_04250 [Candidatus Omnitrophica bacterium]|nr:hypothetical protein [Candidatus Omnitrophota bacterium]
MKKWGKKHRIILTVLFFVTQGGMSVYRTLHDSTYQARLNLQYHPVASILGSIFPALLLSPILYWWSGRFGRGNQKKSN